MKRIIITMTLILALALGAFALAEVTEPEIPAEQSEQAMPEAEAAPAGEAADAAATDTTATLEDALNALRDARLSSKLDELQAELDEYVAAGKLTQEQADLIMNSVKERQAAMQSNGKCDCQQMSGNQRQRSGMRGGNRQFGQFSNGQQGGNQMPQMPGMQGGSQMPQMPGMQGGDNQFGQFPGQW